MVDIQNIAGGVERGVNFIHLPATVQDIGVRVPVFKIDGMPSQFASITRSMGNAVGGALWRDPDLVESEDLGGYGEPPLNNTAAIVMLALVGGVLATAGILTWLSYRKEKAGADRGGPKGPGGVGPVDDGAGKPPAKKTSTRELMYIADRMGVDLGVGDALVLKSSAKEVIRVTGRDDEGMTPFSAEGLPNEEDAVPVLYHWLRGTLRKNANSDFKTISSQFVGLVKQANAPGIIPEDDMPDTLSKSVGQGDLLDRVTFQIKYGTGMFNVEAITAHLGAYWESVLAEGGKFSEIAGKAVKDIHTAFSDKAKGVEGTILFHHDLSAAHSNAMVTVREDRADKFNMAKMLHRAVLVELYYRNAACATEGSKRDEHLKTCRGYLDSCGSFFKYASGNVGINTSLIWQYVEQLRSVVDEGIELGGIAGPMKPIGIRVGGYAPTSASIVRGRAQAMPRINHLTRFRPIGK